MMNTDEEIKMVQERRKWRAAYRRELHRAREFGKALDVIANWTETTAEVTNKFEGMNVPSALTEAVAAYARRVLSENFA